MEITTLSKKESRVFDLIGEGYPNREIAKMLELSPRTTETYRMRIKMKLGLKSTPEIIKHWIWKEIRKPGLCIGSDIEAIKKILGIN